MYKSGIYDTKSAISLKRSSLEPKLLQSVYVNSCIRPINWWHICWPRVNFGLLFWESKIMTADISHTSSRSATKFGRVRGLTIRNLFPAFRALWSGCPVMPCGNMHPSFTDALVKWFFDTPHVCR